VLRRDLDSAIGHPLVKLSRIAPVLVSHVLAKLAMPNPGGYVGGRLGVAAGNNAKARALRRRRARAAAESYTTPWDANTGRNA
jgi:cysteine synthase